MIWRTLFAVFIAATLTGCMSMVVSDMPDNQWEFHGLPFKEDDIVAIGRVVSNESGVNQTASVAFLGRNGTYLVTEGGEDLLKIAKTPGAEMVIVKATPQSLFANSTSFWGKVDLMTPPSLSVDDAQAARLVAVGFTAVSTHKRNQYERSVMVKGVIAPPVSITQNAEMALSTSRKVYFYHPKNETAPPNYKKSILGPLALVGDVVTAPVQILGAATLLIIIEANGGIRVIR